MTDFGRVARRLGEFVLTLVVLSAVVFALLHLAPGDPARVLVGTRQASPELLAEIRTQFHLDDSLWQQYFRWIGGVFTGDLGTSIRTGLPVTEIVADRAGVTLKLAGLAGLLAVAVGVPAGVAAARRHGRPADHTINAVAIAGVSAPSYAIGLLGLYVFSVWLGWLPVYGLGSGGLDTARHLVLPVVTLALGVVASIIKVTRAAMIREVNSDYSSFARSRGLSERSIVGMQLGNAAAPIITSTGLVLASLVGGTVLVETVFSLGGLGGLLAESVTFKDIPVVQAITLIMAVFICSASALADTAALFLNPRAREARPMVEAAVAPALSTGDVR